MVTANYHIRFNFVMETAQFSFTLEADVQEHHSDTYYTVSNICIVGRPGGTVLPPLSIRKEGGVWVHIDSHKPSALSIAAGDAIDAVISGDSAA